MSNIEQELINMETRLTEMENKIDSIDRKLTQVVDAILGNSLTGKGGVVNDLEQQKKDIEELKLQVAKHEEFRKKVYWVGAVIAALITLLQLGVNFYVTLRK